MPVLKRRAGARELGVNLDALAHYLGGDVIGHDSIVFPGPGHSVNDRSASIRFTEDCFNKVFKSHSFSNPEEKEEIERTVIAALREMGWDGEAISLEGGTDARTPEQKREYARSVWMAAVPPEGTLVEAYLRSRGLTVAMEDISEVIRFHGNCPFGRGNRVPCMVAAVRDIVTDEGLTLHRTALTLFGAKNVVSMNGENVTKAVMGSVKGGAIKFGEPANGVLGVGEGIETALTLGQGLEIPVWSMVSANNMAKLPVLEGVRELYVAEDQDEMLAGRRATKEVCNAWVPKGREVHIVRPEKGLKDLNDMIDQTKKARGTE
jgi:hypothetical protein